MGDVLDLAESSGAALPLSRLTTENKALSRQIFDVLVNLLTAMLELRRCGRGDGLECWRLLCQRYEQATTSRLAAMLNSILRPMTFAQDALGFETALKDWELQVSKWESMASDLLNDAVKRQVLQEQAPAAIRLQIMMQGHDAYDRMHNAVLGYVVSSRDWSSQARAQQPKNYGSDPLDVDAITWKGGKDAKGKSKGKGKGKPQQKDSAKETRECWVCGKAGHLSSACWHKDSDKDGGSGGSKGKGKSKMKDKKGGKHKTVSEVGSTAASTSSVGPAASGVGQPLFAARSTGHSGLHRHVAGRRGRSFGRQLDHELGARRPRRCRPRRCLPRRSCGRCRRRFRSQ